MRNARSEALFLLGSPLRSALSVNSRLRLRPSFFLVFAVCVPHVRVLVRSSVRVLVFLRVQKTIERSLRGVPGSVPPFPRGSVKKSRKKDRFHRPVFFSPFPGSSVLLLAHVLRDCARARKP